MQALFEAARVRDSIGDPTGICGDAYRPTADRTQIEALRLLTATALVAVSGRRRCSLLPRIVSERVVTELRIYGGGGTGRKATAVTSSLTAN
jgi:hypothetical protein